MAAICQVARSSFVASSILMTSIIVSSILQAELQLPTRPHSGRAAVAVGGFLRCALVLLLPLASYLNDPNKPQSDVKSAASRDVAAPTPAQRGDVELALQKLRALEEHDSRLVREVEEIRSLLLEAPAPVRLEVRSTPSPGFPANPHRHLAPTQSFRQTLDDHKGARNRKVDSPSFRGNGAPEQADFQMDRETREWLVSVLAPWEADEGSGAWDQSSSDGESDPGEKLPPVSVEKESHGSAVGLKEEGDDGIGDDDHDGKGPTDDPRVVASQADFRDPPGSVLSSASSFATVDTGKSGKPLHQSPPWSKSLADVRVANSRRNVSRARQKSAPSAKSHDRPIEVYCVDAGGHLRLPAAPLPEDVTTRSSGRPIASGRRRVVSTVSGRQNVSPPSRTSGDARPPAQGRGAVTVGSAEEQFSPSSLTGQDVPSPGKPIVSPHARRRDAEPTRLVRRKGLRFIRFPARKNVVEQHHRARSHSNLTGVSQATDSNSSVNDRQPGIAEPRPVALPMSNSIVAMLAKFDDPSVDVDALAALTDWQPLLCVTMHAMVRFGLLQLVGCDRGALELFLKVVEASYDPLVPYHFSSHTADVVVSTCRLLVHNHSPHGYAMDFRPVELMALIIAAAVHDVNHPGVNNAFLVQGEDPLAIDHNDQSVLENHHAATAFHLMRHPSLNFLRNIPRPDFRKFRENVIGLVLATDMSCQLELITEFQSALLRNSH